MFYSSDLLVFKKGKFSLIWLAATRGERHISKKDLKLVDINSSCVELLEYIRLRQKMKLSLYLSSQLTFGICVLYRKQIDKLLYDLQELYKKSQPLSISVKIVSDKPKGNKKSKSNDLSIGNIIEEFPSYNENFGILNDLDNSLVNKDNFNYNASFNQARVEDITFMEYDMVPSTLRNHLENDLEPLNAELLQELLGASDVHNDLERLLQRPFNEDITITDRIESDIICIQPNERLYSDLDCEMRNRDNENLNGNALIESAFFKSNRDADKEMNSIVEIQNQSMNEITAVKSSRAIDEIEFCKSATNAEMIELQYPITKKSRITNKFVSFQIHPIATDRRIIKRKPHNRPLIVDNVTTINHQVIRENMNKSKFCLVDKNSLFPNALVSRSLKAQIVCSANSLLEFPGNANIFRSRKLLSFWMKRKNICQNMTESFIENYNKPNNAVALDVAVVDRNKKKSENVNNMSDVSIEHARGLDSSRRTTMQMDSFTMGSDSLQKSIMQNSFDADKTVEDISIKMTVEEQSIHPLDVSMLPIIEEDLAQRVEQQPAMVEERPVVDKCGVWRVIREKFEERLSEGSSDVDVRVSFYDLCPRGSLKKTAALFLITLLRLAKYNKVRLYQDKCMDDIFVGLPRSHDHT